MSRLIDADAYVTVMLYDDEHEEYYEERMTISEALDRYTSEGCPPTIDAVSIEDVIAIIDDLYREGVIDYMQAWELRMRIRAKGADDEVR